MPGAGQRVERARSSRRDSQSSPSRVLPAAEHYSLADLDSIYRDPQDLLFNIEPQQILEQAMVESHEVLDRSIFAHAVTRNNHVLDSDDSKDFLGDSTSQTGLISDNIETEDMELDTDIAQEIDPLLDVKPPEPDFDTD